MKGTTYALFTVATCHWMCYGIIGNQTNNSNDHAHKNGDHVCNRGIHMHKNGSNKLVNVWVCMSYRDGPVKRTETRQG